MVRILLSVLGLFRTWTVVQRELSEGKRVMTFLFSKAFSEAISTRCNSLFM